MIQSSAVHVLLKTLAVKCIMSIIFNHIYSLQFQKKKKKIQKTIKGRR